MSEQKPTETGETIAQLTAGLIAAFKARKLRATWEPGKYDEHRGHVRAAGAVDVDIVPRYARRGRFSRAPGEITGYDCKIGGYGGDRFPPRKAGHDYAAVVDCAITRFEAARASQRYQAERQRKREEASAELRATLIATGAGDTLAGAVSVMDDASYELHLRRLTLAQVRALLLVGREVIP